MRKKRKNIGGSFMLRSVGDEAVDIHFIIGNDCESLPDELVSDSDHCILATLPLAYCMTGCSNDTDYGGFSYFIWANDSDHRITLSVAREYGELVIENEIIEPGESFESERVDGAIAYCPPPLSYIRYVEVVFEDGTKAIYIKGYQPPRDSDYYSRQDPTIDWNYEEEVTASHAVRTRWTYTFTNADYEAAVAQQFAE